MASAPTMYAYRHGRPPVGRWAQEARRVILAAIDAHRGAPTKQVIAAIDAAYPFGPREMHPYKQWLKERRAALLALETPERFCDRCSASLPPWADERCSGCEPAKP